MQFIARLQVVNKRCSGAQIGVEKVTGYWNGCFGQHWKFNYIQEILIDSQRFSSDSGLYQFEW